MEQVFNVIEIKFSDDFLNDSYYYVSQITTDNKENLRPISIKVILLLLKVQIFLKL